MASSKTGQFVSRIFNGSPLKDYYIPDTQRKTSISPPRNGDNENNKVHRVYKTLEKLSKPDEGIFENLSNLLLHDPAMQEVLNDNRKMNYNSTIDFNKV
jgi:hypothetical protein